MKVTGTAALALLVVQFALFIWGIYLTVKIAEHVNAWPF